jgi:signal transduction histidine kinase/ActR/RegA family two-component response regulator
MSPEANIPSQRPPSTRVALSRRSARDRPGDAIIQRLIESMVELRFEGFLADLPDPMLGVDRGGFVRFVNAQAEHLFGRPRGDLIGLVGGTLLRWRGNGPLPPSWAGGPDDPKLASPVAGVEMVAVRTDGSEVPVEVTLSHVGTREGLWVIAAIRDVTDRKAAEEALNRVSEEAARANRAKTEFLSRMSHELRTPLTAVLGFGQLLEQRRVLPDQQAEAAGHILKAGRHLLKLIDEVLDLASIEEGRLALSPEPVRIGDVMDDALTLIRPGAQQRGIGINVFDGHADCQVTADRQRLTQVFLNLLSNAVKYNHERGTVTLSCAECEGHLTVSVRDEGYGIPPELQSRLFSPFDRLGAEKTEVEGTGLGLALSQRLVQAMNGTLGVESALGEGSTFWVTLPIVKSPLDEVQAPTKLVTATQEQAQVCTVLYIEDNLSNLRLVEQILDSWQGIRLIPAMQGRLGIELATQHHPDLILLDLNLPDVGGRQVLSRIRSNPATTAIPVIVLTADATLGVKDGLLGSGATAFLTKPFDLDEFFEVVGEILDAAPGRRTTNL